MAAAREKLGNKCTQCPEVNNLQLDHLDRADKSFTIGKLWNTKLEVFNQEVAKCQLLCAKCHELKTLKDLGQVSAKTTHGTLSSYRYCKCELCRKANAEYCKLKKRKKKQQIIDRLKSDIDKT
jgi:hypothetical protein